jgi:hypothetical protein
MRIIDIRERAIRISRYRDSRIPSGGLTTSLVAVVTDVVRTGQPVVGYGFASIGRYAQSGLIRERFAPRLLRASAFDGYHSARRGTYRIIYRINEDKHTVEIHSIRHRRDAYRT